MRLGESKLITETPLKHIGTEAEEQLHTSFLKQSTATFEVDIQSGVSSLYGRPVEGFTSQTTGLMKHLMYSTNQAKLVTETPLTILSQENTSASTEKVTFQTSSDIFSGQSEDEWETFRKDIEHLNPEFLKAVGKRSLPERLPVSKSIKSSPPKISKRLHTRPLHVNVNSRKIILKVNTQSLLPRTHKLNSTRLHILRSSGKDTRSIINASHSLTMSNEEYTMKGASSVLVPLQRNSLVLPPLYNLFSKQYKPQKVSNGKISRRSHVCEFEMGLCGWRQTSNDNLNWILTQGRWNPPSEFHMHLDIPRGAYLSLRNFTTPLVPGQKALLLSPMVNSTNCISFWYSSLKHTMGTLNVYTRPGHTLLWSDAGHKKMEWTKAKIQLSPSRHMILQVVLEGIAGPSTESNLVIDNLYAGQCR
ncbi:MAM domain-containing glycosylphosphatidylinositol anchor protein 1-like [Pelobates fuscus]|uniref:MAM domain-containing glycosylphosphatidylinositol anchor protein 1-like n=1 Tax=Pelobates fuscus TaxID=191477 RepID=UPI002FE49CC6